MRKRREGSLVQLTFMPRIFPVNCYLYEEEKELTLIDAALGYSAKGILRTAKDIGKPISRIVLTHAHGDHVGALDAIKEVLPEALVYISKRDARLMKGDVSLDPGELDLPIQGMVPKKLRTKPDVLLQDGDRIGTLTSVSTPGHTPGSMSFLTQDGAVIAGDAFQTRGGIAVTGNLRPKFPFPAWATWSKEMALESAIKLLALDPKLLAVGHGNWIKEPKAAIQRAIKTASQQQVKDVEQHA